VDVADRHAGAIGRALDATGTTVPWEEVLMTLP
jgi:hypothetical protein